MNFNELLGKYQALQVENKQLKKRIEQLETKAETDLGKSYQLLDSTDKKHGSADKPNGSTLGRKSKTVDNLSKPSDKIDLFMSLLKGRNDVYAERWENQRKGTSGYSPACGNEWIPGICQKPKVKCSVCKSKAYLQPNETVIEKHLRGEIIAGIYPLLTDETC